MYTNTRRNINKSNNKKTPFVEDPECAVFLSGFRTDIHPSQARDYREEIYQHIHKKYKVYIRKLDLPVRSKVAYLHLKNKQEANKLMNLDDFVWDQGKKVPTMCLANDEIKVYAYKRRESGNNTRDTRDNNMNLRVNNSNFHGRYSRDRSREDRYNDNKSYDGNNSSMSNSRYPSQDPSRSGTPSKFDFFSNGRSRTISKNLGESSWRNLSHNPMNNDETSSENSKINSQDDYVDTKQRSQEQDPVVNSDSAIHTNEVSEDEFGSFANSGKIQDWTINSDQQLSVIVSDNSSVRNSTKTPSMKENGIRQMAMTTIQPVKINELVNSCENNESTQTVTTVNMIDAQIQTQKSVGGLSTVTVIQNQASESQDFKIAQVDQETESVSNNFSQNPLSLVESTNSGSSNNTSSSGNTINTYDSVVYTTKITMCSQKLLEIWPKEFSTWPQEEMNRLVLNFYAIYMDGPQGPDNAVALIDAILKQAKQIQEQLMLAQNLAQIQMNSMDMVANILSGNSPVSQIQNTSVSY